ncbi:MAG: hypothetical protein ACI97A_001573 [Planctomycetota bacterium]|jgi:hypothetical protein
MIFRYMEKHRVGILLVILFTMIGFGFWSYVVDYLKKEDNTDVEAGTVMAEFTLFGKTVEVPKERLEQVGENTQIESMSKDDAARRLSFIIREDVLGSDMAYNVSQDAFERMIKERIIDQIKRSNNGKVTDADIRNIANRMRMTVPNFKETLRKQLREAMTFRELDRPGRMPTSDQVFERYQIDNQTLLIRALCWDSDSFRDAIKLPRDKDDMLTVEGMATLNKAWMELKPEERQRYHRKGALIDTEFFGFDFEQHKTDEDMLAAFTQVDAKSGKSLKALTEEMGMTPADEKTFLIRLEQNRELYGLAADDDIAKVFESRKKRWTQEIKILKLVKKLHDETVASMAKKEAVDFAKVAADNNLTYYRWNAKYVLDLRDPKIAFQSTALFGLNSTALKVKDIFNYQPAVGPTSAWFFKGPVDQPGRFVATFHLLTRDQTPEAKLEGDILTKYSEEYENKLAAERRDEAFASFETKFDAVMAEMAKAEIDKIKEDTAKAITEAIKDLDAEKDKDKIAEITKEQNEDSEALMDSEKNKFRTEAFNKVLDEKSNLGLLIEEGFFRPFFASREAPAGAKATFEQKARSFVRREFSSLHDVGYQKIYHDEGKVSEIVNSRSYRGMKGIGQIVKKKSPTVEHMLLHPRLMAAAESNVRRDMEKKFNESSMWSNDSMKELNFDLKTDTLDQRIEENLLKSQESDANINKFDEEIKRRSAARAKKLADDAAASTKAIADKVAADKKAAEDAKKATEAGGKKD